ncbi:MAG TPA: hypothetical protein PKD84_08075 [Propionicimonas sp.]|nr:hypothetical protein [Propionicimonas sp.]
MQIKEQLDHLDRTLLATVLTQFPEPLSAPEKAQVHAYLVLSHAVLEEYLESTFERHFDRLCGWFISGLVPLECVRLAFAVGQEISRDEAVYRIRSTPELIRSRGRMELSRRLDGNHGLKSSNVQSMAKFVGVHWPDLENELNAELNDLDTLGAKRGAASHLSPYTAKATNIANSDGPDDVRKWVHDGWQAVQSIAEYLDHVVSAQQPPSLIADWDGN